MTVKIGITFYSVLRIPVADILEVAKNADASGFEYVGIGESFFRDGYALASSIAQNTRRIKIGTVVMPIYTRSPFQIAMGAATVQEISNGRLGFLGLGVGYKERTEAYFGIRQDQRVQRMREYVEIIRDLLSGKETTHHGRLFNFEDFPRLSKERLDIPIFFGSSAPRMLELAGEIADGVVLNSISTPEYLEYALERIKTGASRAGRDISKFEIGHSVIYSVSENYDEAVRTAKEDVLFYISYPELDPVLAKSPFQDQALEIRDLCRKGRKKEASELISEEMLEMFAVYGTPEECRSRLKSFLRRGITLPFIRVAVSGGDRKAKATFDLAISSLAN